MKWSFTRNILSYNIYQRHDIKHVLMYFTYCMLLFIYITKQKTSFTLAGMCIVCTSRASVMTQASTVLTRYLRSRMRHSTATIARWPGCIQALMAGVTVLNRFQSFLKEATLTLIKSYANFQPIIDHAEQVHDQLKMLYISMGKCNKDVKRCPS